MQEVSHRGMEQQTPPWALWRLFTWWSSGTAPCWSQQSLCCFLRQFRDQELVQVMLLFLLCLSFLFVSQLQEPWIWLWGLGREQLAAGVTQGAQSTWTCRIPVPFLHSMLWLQLQQGTQGWFASQTLQLCPGMENQAAYRVHVSTLLSAPSFVCLQWVPAQGQSDHDTQIKNHGKLNVE